VRDLPVGVQTMTWQDFKDNWSVGWKYLWREAQDTYAAAIAADPTGYAKRVEAFLAELTGARQNLDAMKAKLPNPPTTVEEKALVDKYLALEKRYHELAAGFYSEARPAATIQVGFVPVLVVAGLAVSAAAVAWAVPGYEYAVNLREQTALAVKELDARVVASKEGRTLQATTLPPPPPPPASPMDAMKGLGTLLVGGLVVAAGFVVVPQLLNRK
jgi:hypothetical protein